MHNFFKNLSTLELALHIKSRPGMFFANGLRLSYLDYMLWAFNKNSKKESNVPFQYFNYWVKLKLNKFGAIYNSTVAILESCNNDEEKAFWKFYDLLDEFLSLKPISLVIGELTQENLAFYYDTENTNKEGRFGNDNKLIVKPAPYVIKIFEFDYCVHAYHFDYYWLIGEYKKNLYNNHFNNIVACKKHYKATFGKIEWKSENLDLVQKEFSNTILNCRNRRQTII